MLKNWENKTFEGIHYSRFIASWNNKTYGKYPNPRVEAKAFRAFLRSIKVNGKDIPEEVIHEMSYLKTDGKLELEELAKAFEFKE